MKIEAEEFVKYGTMDAMTDRYNNDGASRGP